MITAVQTENGKWVAAFEGQVLGDSRVFETRVELMAWARTFFGPSFEYDAEPDQ